METDKIKNKTLFAHHGNGWNFGIEAKSLKFRVFRYSTNGHVNTNYNYSPWQEMSKMDKYFSEKEFNNISILGQEAANIHDAKETLERIFNNL